MDSQKHQFISKPKPKLKYKARPVISTKNLNNLETGFLN